MTQPTIPLDTSPVRPVHQTPTPGSRGTPLFRDGPIHGLALVPLRRCEDHRGWLIELFREDELDSEHIPVMAYVSQTLPGEARGPHSHQEQSDLFGFFGPGDFDLYLWDARPDSPTFGNKQVVLVGASNRRTVLVPAGVVHGYRNVSGVPGLVFNSPNRLYAGTGRKQPVDEIRYEDLPDNPYPMD